MRVLVTGANGFIGKNLVVRLHEQKNVEVLTLTRDDPLSSLAQKVAQVDMIFHVAGVNRPKDDAEFVSGNTDLTVALCNAVRAAGTHPVILHASSTQVERGNAYGNSKKGAEDALLALATDGAATACIYRLPNVFGKWSRPNYNSVVATFCHNIARGLAVQINDPGAMMDLVYVDDLADEFLRTMTLDGLPSGRREVSPSYRMSVGELAATLHEFEASRQSLVSPPVGTGLIRALYATYVSHFPTEHFSYPLTRHEDPRGVFVEMLKTRDSGQFSYFTAYPGITRGGHYHHSKTEKFLVLKGRALFRFRHMVSRETYEVSTDGTAPQVVETIPGWTHDITNVGDDEMIVMLWANEIFDRERPDTIAERL
jgi:UDP-2-acetamido-2,6-beta-L-arabino-hexul-4-ose reductase